MIQHWNQLQSTLLRQMPLTNTFCMPPKCIYTHTHEVFTIWSCIQAYKGNANVYGPLWTPSSICAIWTYFSQYSPCFSSFIPSQKTLSLPTSSTIIWQTFSITTASCMSSPPYILLYAPHSPVICKDLFSLIYMYKSSRYYVVFNINLGSIFPRSTSLYIRKTPKTW